MKPKKTSKTSRSKAEKSGSVKKLTEKPGFSKEDLLVEKNKYEKRIVEAIDGIDEKIDHLKKESVKLKETAKARMDEQIIFLSKKQGELQESLKDMREHSGDRWKDFKDGVEKGIAEIDGEAKELFAGVKGGFNYLFSKFKRKGK